MNLFNTTVLRDLKPGDTVVFTTPKALNRDQHAHIQEALTDQLPAGVKALVTESGISVHVAPEATPEQVGDLPFLPVELFAYWPDGSRQHLIFDHWPRYNDLPPTAVRFDIAVPDRTEVATSTTTSTR